MKNCKRFISVIVALAIMLTMAVSLPVIANAEDSVVIDLAGTVESKNFKMGNSTGALTTNDLDYPVVTTEDTTAAWPYITVSSDPAGNAYGLIVMNAACGGHISVYNASASNKNLMADCAKTEGLGFYKFDASEVTQGQIITPPVFNAAGTTTWYVVAFFATDDARTAYINSFVEPKAESTVPEKILTVSFTETGISETSGNDYTITTVGTPTTKYSEELGRYVMTNDGSKNNYSIFGYDKYYDAMLSSFTWECYALYYENNQEMYCMSNLHAGGFAMGLDTENDQYIILMRDNGSYDELYFGADEANKWTHIVATFDGQTVSLYCDGKLVDSSVVDSFAWPSAAAAKYLAIGADTSGDQQGEYFWNGEIAFCNIYSKCLTADEVATLYTNATEGNKKSDTSVTFHGASFDTFLINGTRASFQANDGGASAALDTVNRTVDGSDGSIETISLRGWIGFEQEIEALGYQIGDNDPVFGDFKQAAEDAVKLDANGGSKATRFQINIPVADVTGTQTIVAVAKVNGQVVKLDSSLPTVGAATCPNTSFTYVGRTPVVTYHGASFDTFLINGERASFQPNDGAASAALDTVDRTVDGSDGSIETISIRGWIGFEQDIQALGYQIGDNAPVFGDFVVDFANDADKGAVQADANGGSKAVRFQINVPVADVTGTQTIVAVAKVDGQVVKLDSSLATVGAATAPNTSFTYVGKAATPSTADASMVVFMVAAAALVVTVVLAKKKEF